MDDSLFRMKIFMNGAIRLLIRGGGEGGIKADFVIGTRAPGFGSITERLFIHRGLNKKVNGNNKLIIWRKLL